MWQRVGAKEGKSTWELGEGLLWISEGSVDILDILCPSC